MKIEIENEKMQVVTPKIEGNFLTAYKDDDDILKFSSSEKIYAPLSVDVKKMFRVITFEENEMYLKKVEEKRSELDLKLSRSTM